MFFFCLFVYLCAFLAADFLRLFASFFGLPLLPWMACLILCCTFALVLRALLTVFLIALDAFEGFACTRDGFFFGSSKLTLVRCAARSWWRSARALRTPGMGGMLTLDSLTGGTARMDGADGTGAAPAATAAETAAFEAALIGALRARARTVTRNMSAGKGRRDEK